MKKQSLLLIAILLLSGQYALAGAKLKSGDLSALKGTKEFNIEYDYSNMSIGKKKKAEADYMEEKKKKYDEKEPGSGDKWIENWNADRDKRFAPKFKELFEDNCDAKLVEGGAKYTLIVHVVNTEPGFNIGVTRQSAMVDFMVDIVEAANPSHIIATIDMKDIPGGAAMGYDFDSGTRISESYAKAGKELGKMLKKKI